MKQGTSGGGTGPPSGGASRLLPPASLRDQIGAGDFRAVGEEFLGHFRQLAGLRPNEDVLDVGCGVGRMAIPLTEFLLPAARYEGFDVVPELVEWCSANITPAYPNFRFAVSDLYSSTYNPLGAARSEEYEFSYPDETFDFVFLTSVFTHLLPAAVARYLSEIRRVLRPGGRSFMTFFLLDAETLDLIRGGRSTLAFEHDRGRHRLLNEEAPEAAVAYDLLFARELIEGSALKIERVERGSRCGREEFLTYQDVLVVSK
jgi:SAM-dependent methyltransferase